MTSLRQVIQLEQADVRLQHADLPSRRPVVDAFGRHWHGDAPVDPHRLRQNAPGSARWRCCLSRSSASGGSTGSRSPSTRLLWPRLRVARGPKAGHSSTAGTGSDPSIGSRRLQSLSSGVPVLRSQAGGGSPADATTRPQARRQLRRRGCACQLIPGAARKTPQISPPYTQQHQ